MKKHKQKIFLPREFISGDIVILMTDFERVGRQVSTGLVSDKSIYWSFYSLEPFRKYPFSSYGKNSSLYGKYELFEEHSNYLTYAKGNYRVYRSK